eukprot:5214546-Prorocentrum_lima.AAC.1
MRGVWYLLVVVDGWKEYVLIDSGAACHVCPPTWDRSKRETEKDTQENTLAPLEDMTEIGHIPLRTEA